MDDVRKTDIDCSVIIPVYFNEGLLTNTMASIEKDVIARLPGLRFEVVFVDDGSGDGSLAELLHLQSVHLRTVKIVKFTRNFGQANAIFAGLEHADGKCAVIMSADGQDPTELIETMIRHHRDDKVRVVIAAREGRDESVYRILTSWIFYAIMRKISFPEMPTGGFDFMLLDREVINTILRHREAHPFFQGQILSLGYPMKVIGYRRKERKSGVSRWTFMRKLTYLLDGILGYSFLPIRWMSAIGMTVAVLGFAYAALIVFSRLMWGNPIQGWTPLMVVILVIGGLQMLMLGIVGEYMWRVLAQVRNRPAFVIDRVYDRVP